MTRTAAAATVRTGAQPGDLGAVIALHGRLYSREYGMDQTMEAYVASGIGEFALARSREGTAVGELWVADVEGHVVGSLGMTRAPDGRGQLRWFLVDPSQRGQGVGARLLATALEYARERAFPGVFLWTVGGLDAARHLYLKAGFRVTVSSPARKWGIDTVEECLERPLTEVG